MRTKEDLLKEVIDATSKEFGKVWSDRIKLNPKLAMLYLLVLMGRYGLSRDSRYVDAEKQWVIPIKEYLLSFSSSAHLLNPEVAKRLDWFLSNLAEIHTPEEAITGMKRVA